MHWKDVEVSCKNKYNNEQKVELDGNIAALDGQQKLLEKDASTK